MLRHKFNHLSLDLLQAIAQSKVLFSHVSALPLQILGHLKVEVLHRTSIHRTKRVVRVGLGRGQEMTLILHCILAAGDRLLRFLSFFKQARLDLIFKLLDLHFAVLDLVPVLDLLALNLAHFLNQILSLGQNFGALLFRHLSSSLVTPH